MGMRINTNVPSLAAQRSLSTNRMLLDNNLRKLSSGERITTAADDAAGLAISEKLKAEIRSIRQARRNAGDGISMIQVAEGGLSEISNIIIRLRELSIQAASDTIGDTERSFTDIEFQKLKEEIDRIALSSEFNGQKLLDGTGGIMDFQVGTKNNPALDRISYNAGDADATTAALGMNEALVASKTGAQLAIKTLDDSLVKINGTRANLGALQNRLNSTIQNLSISDENYSYANSRIRDVDVASETADMAKNNILVQSGTSVLAQANQAPGLALKLIS